VSFPVLNLFYNTKFTNQDGSLTSQAQIYHDSLSQTLNTTITNLNAGLTPPTYTTAEVGDLDTSTACRFFYNSTLGKLQFKKPDGTVETVTSS